jgi:hypothetical protein
LPLDGAIEPGGSSGPGTVPEQPSLFGADDGAPAGVAHPGRPVAGDPAGAGVGVG